jgi:energy-converting hydrogenase Eha subunit E
MILRDFRDTYLQTSLGWPLVRLYYAVSPPIAELVAESPVLRALARLLLLPAVGFCWVSLRIGLPLALLTCIVIAVIMGKRIHLFLKKT